MLEEEEMLDRADLVELWRKDALNRRKGALFPLDRATALVMTLDQFNEFAENVAELEVGVWKKAADFYRGMLASDIFKPVLLMHGGIYYQHRAWDWDEIEVTFGVSRSTFFSRLNAGASVTELFKPARTKSKPITLSHDGFDYSPAAFAAEFGLSRKHVQNGIAAALSPEQIINAPPPKKGRPASTPRNPD